MDLSKPLYFVAKKSNIRQHIRNLHVVAAHIFRAGHRRQHLQALFLRLRRRFQSVNSFVYIAQPALNIVQAVKNVGNLHLSNSRSARHGKQNAAQRNQQPYVDDAVHLTLLQTHKKTNARRRRSDLGLRHDPIDLVHDPRVSILQNTVEVAGDPSLLQEP